MKQCDAAPARRQQARISRLRNDRRNQVLLIVLGLLGGIALLWLADLFTVFAQITSADPLIVVHGRSWAGFGAGLGLIALAGVVVSGDILRRERLLKFSMRALWFGLMMALIVPLPLSAWLQARLVAQGYQLRLCDRGCSSALVHRMEP